jgi:hypothetical protein
VYLLSPPVSADTAWLGKIALKKITAARAIPIHVKTDFLPSTMLYLLSFQIFLVYKVKKKQESNEYRSPAFWPILFNQVMRIHMTIQAARHLLVHKR